jgi:hypothetical protein
MFAEPERASSEDAEKNQRQRGERSDAFGESLPEIVTACPRWHAPAQRGESQHADGGADPPRRFEKQLAERFILATHG